MLGIVGAEVLEVEELKKLMTIEEEKEIYGYRFYCGMLAGKETVVVRGGIGKVNATISMTLMLNHFDIDHVVNIGTAGGLRLNQEVGDLIVSERVVHHDVDVIGFNHPYGEVPGMPLYYEADPEMLQIAKEILTDYPHHYYVGLIASGDTFVCEQSQVDKIMKYFPDALCAEMEAAAIAQVCYVFQKPFIITRGLSDIFNKGSNKVQFDTYISEASHNSAKMCMAIAERLV